jgi:hypothetical protein
LTVGAPKSRKTRQLNSITFAGTKPDGTNDELDLNDINILESVAIFNDFL